MPLVSVVIACLNASRFLPAALQSVLSQSLPNLEIVVIDGGSTDGTVELLQHENDPRLRWISETDTGIAHAWNKGVKMCTGAWILFLGADDYLWNHGVLQACAPHLKEAQAAFAFGDVVRVGRDGSVVEVVGFEPQSLANHIRSGQDIGLPHQGFFHHRERAFVSGGFDVSHPMAADYELLARGWESEDFYRLPVGPVTAFRTGGMSANPWSSIPLEREFQRIQKKHGLGSWTMDPWTRTKAYVKIVMKGVLGRDLSLVLINKSRKMRGLSPHSV